MIKTDPLSIKKIKEISEEIRKIYHIDDKDYFPIYDILDKLYGKGKIGIQVLENDNPFLENNTPAKYNASDNFIYIKEEVLNELANKNYRNNFTLCHEFFHYIQIKILNMNLESTDYCKSYEDVEWQANEFAGQLLIPEKYLFSKNEEALANQYHTTVECVLYRRVKLKKRSS